jgi:hypothetical protein
MNIKSRLLLPMMFAIVAGTAHGASGEEVLSGLTAQERSWVEDSCPRSLGPRIFLSCVEREVAAIRAGIPDVAGLPDDQQAWVRESCPDSLGPRVYASCVKREMSALRGGAVDLDSLDADTRQWIEESCPRSLGPSVYTSCVKRETGALSGGTVDLDSLDPDTRQWVEESCPRSLGPSVYSSCIRRELGALDKQPSNKPAPATARESQPPSRRRAASASESTELNARKAQVHSRPMQPVKADSAVESFQLVLLILLAVFLLPIVWVLFSSRSHGGAKLGWFVVVLFFSWLGFAVFLIVTQRSRDLPNA